MDAQDRVMTSNLPPNCLLEVGPLKSEKKLKYILEKCGGAHSAVWKFRSFQASQIFREINFIEFLSGGKEKIREIKWCSRNIFREIGGKYFSISINFTKKLRQNDEKSVKLSTTKNTMSASAVHCFNGKFNIFFVKSTVLTKEVTKAKIRRGDFT